MTERYLIGGLAATIWRKRRLLLSEGSTINKSLRISIKNTESVVSSAVLFKGGLIGIDIDLRETVATTSLRMLNGLRYGLMNGWLLPYCYHSHLEVRYQPALEHKH